MLPRVHCVTDFATHDGETVAVLERVVAAGVDAVQVRAKALDDRALFGFTRALVDRLAGTGAAVIVDDRLDVALAAGAHGVHLGLIDLPVTEARRLAPPGLLVGATCRHEQHARQARADGADYAGVGPVHTTTTKQGLPAPIGLEPLGTAGRVLPAIAIGGLDAPRAAEAVAAGAYGVAVAGAICRAADPAAAAGEIVAAVRSARSRA